MINVAITFKSRSIICNLHGFDLQFLDLKSLLLHLALLAKTKQILKIEVLTGRGKMDLNLPQSYRDLMLDKIKHFPFVSHIEINKERLASGFIFWFSEKLLKLDKQMIEARFNKLNFKKDKTMVTSLKELKKQLQKEEKAVLVKEVEKKAETKKAKDQRIADLEKVLETTWNEQAVLDLLKQLDSEKNQLLKEAVLNLVADFEIFFSDSFKKEYIKRTNAYEF